MAEMRAGAEKHSQSGLRADIWGSPAENEWNVASDSATLLGRCVRGDIRPSLLCCPVAIFFWCAGRWTVPRRMQSRLGGGGQFSDVWARAETLPRSQLRPGRRGRTLQ
ncbi:MAG: hypothetical protein ACPIOQ_36235 [Promethearchaeia archaeon]